ncbi:MAG: hypothetical protein ACRDQC_12155 [Gaiellales bacterium]
MNPRDRRITIGLFGAVLVAWLAVTILFVSRSPDGDPGLQLFGALLLGIAFTLSTWPLFWLVAFGRHGRIAYIGDWSKALRRGAIVGVVVSVLVVLRVEDAFSVPLALFIVVMALIIEVSLSRQG